MSEGQSMDLWWYTTAELRTVRRKLSTKYDPRQEFNRGGHRIGPIAVGVGFAEPTTDVEAQIIPRETMCDSDEEYSEEDYEYEYSDEDGGAGDEDVSMDGSFDAADAMILTSPSILNDLELGVDETPLSSSSSSRPDDDYPRFNHPMPTATTTMQ